MKVRAAFMLTEIELRTIRAAHGRGGKATRKECLTFIDRAIRDALKRAPEPKPARRKIVKRETPIGLVATGSETPVEAAAARERIRKLYGH